MRVLICFAAVLSLCGAAACSSSTGTTDTSKGSAAAGKTMPNVNGKKLDVAEDAIKTAGGDPDEIKLLGGGRFGVMVKGNWTVCAQSPKAGEVLPASPQITIERDCSHPSTAFAAPTSLPADSSGPTAAAPLTANTSKEFAALLKVGDGCDESVQSFASKYAGQRIEFDGSVSALTKHGDYDTRYDIGIGAGDKGGNTAAGPNFQFQNVNATSDLKYKGAAAANIAVGTKLHIVAEIASYNSTQCLLFLTPVSTRAR